jgi:hypothetical protein
MHSVRRRSTPLLAASTIASLFWAGVCSADVPFFFSTGNPDGLMATGSRPASAGKIEIESADDFVLTGSQTTITNATFTGLLTGAGPTIGEVRVEIYRVFAKDSDFGRTSGVPPFPTSQVPARANSPSDVELEDRDTAAGNLTFTTTDLGGFSADNSVLDGINPKPNFLTGGEGSVTGEEIQFNIAFTIPFSLPSDHYFFVPQVEVSGGEFFWLSAPKPIVPPGTAFPPGFTDLQEWIRNENLAPDWLRVGTDIVGPPPTGGPARQFNATFSLTGTVPEPGTALLVGMGLVGVWWRWRKTR